MKTPKNKEQAEAVEIGIDFINEGDPEEFLIIGGKAGTGKTTIVEMILQPFIKKKKILICALSHKAKLVLSEKLTAAFGDKAIVAKSVAGALGMKMDNETGKFVIDKGAIIDPPIKRADIIVVDEGSMINEDSHDLIMQEKRKKAKVIYLGDIRQLPPIRDVNNIFRDLHSPVFTSKKYVVLKERIRQGEESPILPFSDFYGDNSRRQHPMMDPIPVQYRKSIVNKKGALIIADNTSDVIEKSIPLYKESIQSGNINIIKTVAYRNETRKYINSLVRELLFSDESDKYFIAGDIVMFQDNFELAELDEQLSNSLEVQITKAEMVFNRYKIWQLEFIYESKPISIPVLDQSEIKRHSDDVSELFKKAKALPFGTDERNEALDKAWRLKKKFASVEHAYAITAHKSQGSTYNTVVVCENDIMSVKPISNKEKSQAMYTAITRASHTCIIIDGKTKTSELDSAIKYALDSINENKKPAK